MLAPLENAVFNSFLPAVFGCESSPLEFELFSLPVHFGDLGILLPKHLAKILYDASRSATHTIVDSIRNSLEFELDVHDDNVISAHRNYQWTCDGLFTDLFSAICFKLDPLHAHAL